jgi:hypothetical protein
MKASQGNRRSWGASMLFVAVAGLAVSASGCIIDGGSNDSCSPDLTIPWRIVSNLDNQVITCAEAGNADTVTAWIDGGALGSALTAFPVTCPATQSQGALVALLPSTGSYNVSLELTSGGTLLSETPVLVMGVDCSGLSQTVRADLFVNF